LPTHGSIRQPCPSQPCPSQACPSQPCPSQQCPSQQCPSQASGAMQLRRTVVPRGAAPKQQCTPSRSPHMPRCTADRGSMQAYTWTLLPRGAWQCTPGQCCICDHHGLLMPPYCGLRGAGCPRKCGHAHQGQYRVAEHTHCLCLGTCALLRGSVRDNRLLCLRGGKSLAPGLASIASFFPRAQAQSFHRPNCPILSIAPPSQLLQASSRPILPARPPIASPVPASPGRKGRGGARLTTPWEQARPFRPGERGK